MERYGIDFIAKLDSRQQRQQQWQQQRPQQQW